jgi:hypothetical protein
VLAGMVNAGPENTDSIVEDFVPVMLSTCRASIIRDVKMSVRLMQC